MQITDSITYSVACLSILKDLKSRSSYLRNATEVAAKADAAGLYDDKRCRSIPQNEKREVTVSHFFSGGLTSVHLATDSNSWQCIDHLLSHCTTDEASMRLVAARDSSGETALELAARRGFHLCLKTLLSHRGNLSIHEAQGLLGITVLFDHGECAEVVLHSVLSNQVAKEVC